MELVGDYLRILNGGAVLFVVNNFLGVFVRNDGDPQRVMAAGIISCLFNILLDYVCIFLLDWGMAGAAGATAFSGFISILIMLTHFKSKSCPAASVLFGFAAVFPLKAHLPERCFQPDCRVFRRIDYSAV